MPPRYRRPRSDDRPMSSATTTKRPRTEPPPVIAPSPTNSRHFSERTFQSALISQASKSAIKHEFMSDVQAATIDLGLAGKDLLVQAKTGTGKTLAFLLPVIERLAKSRVPIKGISVLVLAPTRELALQIEKEAQILLEHHKGMSVGHVMGGTNVRSSMNTLLKNPPTILVATPGRLHDHLTDKETASAVCAQFTGVQAFVLDEADRLLDQGFRRELHGIIRALPSRQQSPRQVMLFSATVSKEIREVAREALNSEHVFVSTLGEDEANTHEHVPQTYITTPFSSTLPTALQLLHADILTHPSSSKTIIFFPTARHVSFAASLLSSLQPSLPALPKIFDLHSRMSQSARTRATSGFATASSGILLSSDVAARGMDFPGVTLVVQLGIPASTEQYIHRLGRTARAGTAGRGVIVLSPSEAAFLSTRDTSTLPITASPSPAPAALAPYESAIHTAFANVTDDTKAQAYRAWLGYYKAHLRLLKWDSARLIQEGNAYAVSALGWASEDGKPPGVEARLVGKLGLKGVLGLNITKSVPRVQGRMQAQGGGAGNGGGPRR
ncbi:hypothetical protein C0991_007990 [Blastosporella zonata]|nr:hypothetical protein C0991_007990 [Blastosporella zonata]